MKVVETALPGVRLMTPARHEDARGWFAEIWNQRDFAAAGIDDAFIQDNQVLTRRRGTVRGLHFQTEPFVQAKLVRVLSGAIFDVCVDIRRGSPGFGRHVAVELSAAEGSQLFVPGGFAHGYCTLMPDTVVLYKVTNRYAASHEGGVLWCDPDIGIAWPVAPEAVLLSDKDRRWPRLAELWAEMGTAP